jgi:hypothetical protein
MNVISSHFSYSSLKQLEFDDEVIIVVKSITKIQRMGL